MTGSRVKNVVKGDAQKKITSHKIKTEDFTPHPDGSSNVDMLTYCLNNLIKIKSSISAGDYGLNYKSGVLDGLIYSLEYALSKNKLDRDPLSYFKYVVS